MTMDVTSNNRKLELKSDITCDDQTQIIVPIKAAKRPFDVAFLMLPDDKLKQKQAKKSPERGNYNNNENLDEEDEEIEVGTHQDFKNVHHHKYFTQKQQIFDDPNLIKAKNLDELRSRANNLPQSSLSEQKSAFTKVNLSNNNTKDSRLSPNLSISPDLSYQNSLSPSPPINRHNYHQNAPQNAMLSPSHFFKNHQSINAYQSSFLQENFNSVGNNHQNLVENGGPFLMKNPNELIQPNFPKMRPSMYRPELSYSYQQFPNHQEMLKMGSGPDIRGPAAAILTSLLPPSLAALSLPAQNVCAKCNISFRMTSDLVYHMRSHHKNDSVDMHKRRREEKLKCPVCAESFRERHHLTRHMTAHQDKDEDENVKKPSVK